MKQLFTGLLLLLTISLPADAQQSTDRLLRVLHTRITQAPAYDTARIRQIQYLQSSPAAVGNNPVTRFDQYRRLYNEYRIFIFDSAYRYAGIMQDIAYHLADSRLIIES